MRSGEPIAREGGFTLMEMMMVVAIIGLIMGVSVVTLRNVTRADLRSSAGKTAAAMRFAFDRALMTGSYIRLAIDMEKGRLWLERTDDRVSLASGEEEKKAREREEEEDGKEGAGGPPKAKKRRNNPLAAFGTGSSGDEGESFGVDAETLLKAYEAANEPPERPKPRFARFKGPGVKEIKLKGGIVVEAVKTARMEEPIDKGMAYVYFFPQGHAEPAIVRLMNKSEDYYSIVLHPLTGSARIYSCRYRIPDEFGEDDDGEAQRKKRRKRDICEDA